jgi:hypothetical protein
MPDLIGKFKASQGRQRLLVRAEYSHVVVAFHSEIVFVEAEPVRDKARKILKYGSKALTVASGGATALAAPVAVGQHIHLAQHADSLLTKLVEWLPSSGIVARLEGLDELQPDRLEQEFPGHVRRLPIDLVNSATLNRVPFATEMIVRYRDPASPTEAQLWLRPDDSEPLDEVAYLMRQVLADRFKVTRNLGSAARSKFPGRVRIEFV